MANNVNGNQANNIVAESKVNQEMKGRIVPLQARVHMGQWH